MTACSSSPSPSPTSTQFYKLEQVGCFFLGGWVGGGGEALSRGRRSTLRRGGRRGPAEALFGAI
jgi:hypothetical protein